MRESFLLKSLVFGSLTVITYVLSRFVIEVREYVDALGRSPFSKWLQALNVQAAV